jgi:serine protease
MKKLLDIGMTLFVAILFAVSFAGAAENGGGPSFKSGELVVAGAPGKHLDGFKISKYLPHANLTVIQVEKGKEFKMAQRFLGRGHRASLNYTVQATEIPNDSYYDSTQWNFKAIQSEAAWNLSSGADLASGAGVIVAILDTGIAPDGPDGIGCIVSPMNILNEEEMPYDGNGHGTHVAGTIAQTTGNGTGVAGLAYSACIMPLKVLNDSGSGLFSDIADGIYYAVAKGAQVINMSFGTNAQFGVREDYVMDAALEHAYNNGVTVVCSSGNDGYRKNVSYPAIYPTTIAVGATDDKNHVTQYSNKGEGLDIVAPGGDTKKDLNGDGFPDGILQETKINNTWDYYFFQGTSMASSHIAAVAAMLIASAPDYFLAPDQNTPDLVYEALTTTSMDLYKTGYDSTSGYGLVQAYNALIDDQRLGEIDADGDGSTFEDDCDDNDPNVYPGHDEMKGRWSHDGVDNDCNGIIDG